MKKRMVSHGIPAIFMLILLAACSKQPAPEVSSTDGQAESATASEPAASEASMPATAAAEIAVADKPSEEIVPGLTRRILRAGSGQAAEVGHTAVVHYTGWLQDAAAENSRGSKFDSSVDREQPFSFPLGARRVIQGWDKGVEGMQVGEVRELTIAPELAYGERQMGDVITPGSTLIFVVELLGLEGAGTSTQ